MRRIVLAVIVAFAAMPARAEETSKAIAARVEVHAIPSLTLTDQQFLE